MTDSDSDFEEFPPAKRRKARRQKKSSADEVPDEPMNTAASLLKFLTGLLDSEVGTHDLITSLLPSVFSRLFFSWTVVLFLAMVSRVRNYCFLQQ